MPHFDDTVLQAIPEPALIAVHGRVACFNSAAAQIFPDLTRQAPLPDPLPATPGAGFVLVGEQGWQLTVSPVGEGLLYLLHTARLDGVSRPQLDGTVRRLREQMSQLLLSIQLLSREQENPNAPTPAERLTGMNRTLCQMLRLTDQLDLLRDLESGAFRFQPVTLDLAGLCRETVYAAACLLEQTGITLHFDSALTSLLVNGDADLLQKLILELIVNAARAAGKGSTLTLGLARRDERAVLTLAGPGRDDGRPLPQLLSGSSPADRIPQPGEGAGQGLVLIQRVVALHQGTLMMERREGIHSIVALPLAPRGASLPVYTPTHDYTGGFSPVLVALSDLLDKSAFTPADLE